MEIITVHASKILWKWCNSHHKFSKEYYHSSWHHSQLLINLALEEGIFTEIWKVAIICPLIKKLGLELVNSNYRPVSN